MTILAAAYPEMTEAGKLTARIREELDAGESFRDVADRHEIPLAVVFAVFDGRALCHKCAGRTHDTDGHSCGPCNGEGIAR